MLYINEYVGFTIVSSGCLVCLLVLLHYLDLCKAECRGLGELV